jgi:hypothetical protein
MFRYLVILLFCWMVLLSCDNAATPLDADTRYAIDSLSGAQMVLDRKRLDSLCLENRKIELPRLVDSMKQVRLREIEEKLRHLPR